MKIGFSVSTEVFVQERWERDIQIFTSKAKELGAEVLFTKSSKNSDDQVSEILYLAKQDIDVLVIIPRDKNVLGDVLKKVRLKGIPVIAYDRLIMDVPLDAYVSFDNNEVGKYLGKALIDKVPNGKYLIINGSIHDNNSYEVNTGLHKILDPKITSNEIELVDEVWLNEWSYDDAYKEANRVLDLDPEINAISAANDMIAQAVIKALSERRLAGKVYVVGQDADLASCQSIINNTQLMTVYKPIQNLASRAAIIAVSIAGGTIPEPDLYINNNSGKYIPFYFERPIPVTKDNIDKTVILDGFHNREDIYQ